MKISILRWWFLICIGFVLIFPALTFSQVKNSEIQQALQKLKEKAGEKFSVKWHGDGRVKTIEGKLSFPYPGTPENAAKQFLRENAAIFQMAPEPKDIKVDYVKDTFKGYLVAFKQVYKGLPVFNGRIGVHLKEDKSVDTVHSSYLPNINLSIIPIFSEEDVIEIAKNDYIKDCRYRISKYEEPQPCGEDIIKGLTFKEQQPQLGIFEHRGKPQLVYKIFLDVEYLESRFAFLQYTIDVHNGTIFEGGDLIQYAEGTGKVFDPNPVNTLNNTSLQDNRDKDDSIFNSAYFTRSLNYVTFNNGYYYLYGPHVDVTDAVERPFYFNTTSGYILSVSGDFNFTRSPDEFEHVMTYYHIDTNQRYIQSLGFANINNRSIKVDPHGLNGADNSWYVPNPVGAGYLAFGEGGVDDAEDADIILHEYGHAIQDNQAPGKYSFSGSCSTEAGAMGEGFGDYWAASNTYSVSIANGFDPACIGEWDAAPNCLRRVDTTKHYPESIVAECHADGEIWSAMLWDLFKSPLLGKAITDTLVLKSHFNIAELPNNPTFCDGAKALLKADEQLYGGAYKDVISSTMTNRGIYGARFYRVGAITFANGEDLVYSAVIDSTNGFAYFGTWGSPGKIIKVRLSDFTKVGKIKLANGEDNLTSAVIDTVNGFAYFGTGTWGYPGKIIKVRLSDFTRVDAITLNTGENTLYSAVIDTTNGFAYFGTYTTPARIVKIRLSDFTRVDAITLNPDEKDINSGVIDDVNGFAYFSVCCLEGGRQGITKIRLSDFTRVGTLVFYGLENPGNGAAVIDTINGFAYFGGRDYNVAKVFKIRLADFTAVDRLTVSAPLDYYLTSAVIDTTNGFAYFATHTVPGLIFKIRLSDFTEVDSITLSPGENYINEAVIDAVNGFAYFGTATVPGKVVKIDIGTCIY